MSDSDRYTIISADTHAGGSHAQYREFLDPKYRDDFDAWRGKYKNPFSDLGDQRRYPQLGRRDAQLASRTPTASSARSSSRTRCRRSSRASCSSPGRRSPTSTSTASPASAPTTAGSRTSAAGTPSAGPASARSSSTTSTTPSRTSAGSRSTASAAASCCRRSRPTSTGSSRSTTPTTTACGRCARSSRSRSTATAAPARRPTRRVAVVGAHHARRGARSTPGARSLFLLLSGVFERFPNLKFVMTEQGCAWLPPLLDQLDMHPQERARQRRHRRAAVQARARAARSRPPSTSSRTCWFGVSFPARADVEAARTTLGIDRFMWGSDYPHDEGTYPFTTEALRQVFHDWPEADLQRDPGRQRRRALRLRPRRARAAPRPDRPAGRRDRPAPRPSSRRTPTRRCSATLQRPERPSRP